MPPALAASQSRKTKALNTRIIFDDDSEITPDKKPDDSLSTEKVTEEEEDYFSKRELQRSKHQEKKDTDAEHTKKWYHVYSQFPSSENVMDMKEGEQMELYNLCKSSFDTEISTFMKRNPSDSRWLQTALHKGTAKDRANAGALLVTSNPVGNLDALSTLIGFTKISNKSSFEVITILTDLWKEVLLPPHRKLIALPLRGSDWKLVQNDSTLTKDKQRRIFAYWQFENELKDLYFEYLKNLQQGIQTGQEGNKNAAIVSASELLVFAPEKEQMLLTMLINKLGDPVAKVASKALHHLTEVAHKHPNMCGVIVKETEKLLFRSNISDRAQHFALCFLASTAPSGNSEVCSKLVHICFSFFKVLVQKGAVNNRTMQAILRCLQKAIVEVKPATDSSDILTKDMQDTVYRLVHLADIHVSIQTLGLLLQLVTVNSEKSDRFYNALYKKMLDMELTTIGVKTAAQLLHIIHRAIHIDANVPRAKAFLKRLLQISVYMPPHMASACLIVIHKLLRSRKELVCNMDLRLNNNSVNSGPETLPQDSVIDEKLARFDTDREEKYEDACDDNIVDNSDENSEKKEEISSSWHHIKVNSEKAVDRNIEEITASKYDPYHRVPSYAGAELALRHELLLLREHFHPTVQVFADNILNHKRINYYGDPLRDFALPHFLERFAFKNPKKLDVEVSDTATNAQRRYVSFGARGKPVQSLTKTNCTEDEIFIFNYLEQKRKQAVKNKTKRSTEVTEDEDLKENEVTDMEFEDYIGSFFGKKAKAATDAEAAEEAEEMDYLKELSGEIQSDTKGKSKMKQGNDDDSEDNLDDVDMDWGDDDVEGGEDEQKHLDSEENDSDNGSIDLNEDDDDDDESFSSMDENMEPNSSDDETNSMGADDSDDLAAPKTKKTRRNASGLDGRSFTKKLKHSNDMSSLFAAADDFAELLEETGKTKGQGTANAVFNKDKSSDKQMKWEEKRRSNTKTYTKRDKPNAKKRKYQH